MNKCSEMINIIENDQTMMSANRTSCIKTPVGNLLQAGNYARSR